MAAKLTDDILKWTLDIDGKPAMKALSDWEQKTRSVEKANKALETEMAKLKARGKENTDEYRALEKQMKTNNATIRQAKGRMAELRQEVGVTGMTMQQLRQRSKELKTQLDRTVPNTQEWKKLRKELDATEKRMNQVGSSTKKTGGIMGKIGKMMPFAGWAAAGAAAVGAITGVFKNAIRVREEFSRYEAVLKNTLGSQEAANAAFADLKQFAATTPFQLNELTGSYVKLTNMGFKPTMDEMTKMGDLAAAMGKPFDQLSEAIIDAQTGQNERLKEFGIRAQKDGDKVKYTFKGVTTEVDNNAESIRKYLLTLGEMEGVKGGMAEISKTIGGAIANTGDAVDNLWNTIGTKLEPLVVRFLTWFTGAMTNLANWINESEQNFKNIVSWLGKFKGVIVTITAAFVGYNATVKVSNMLTKENTVWTKIAALGQKAWATVTGLLTGKIKIATIAQKAWNFMMAMNPIGLLVGAIAALAAGAVFLVKRLNQASAAQRALNEVQKEAEKATASERNEIEQLVRIAKDERFSREEREKAIKRLNEISPEYLGNLTLENINTEAATKATYDYIKALEEKALVQAIDDKIAKLMEENSNAEIDGNKKKVKWYQTATNAIIAGSNVQMFAELQNKKSLGNEAKANKEYNETLEALMSKRAELLAKGSDATVESGETDDEKAKREEKERFARQTEEKEAARLLAEQRKKDNEKAAKVATQLAKEAYEKELLELRKSMFEKGATRDEMNGVIQLKELEHLSTLLAIQKKYGQDTTSIESSILDKQIKAREDYQKNIEGINKAIADASKDFKLDDEKFETDDEGYQEGIKALDRYQELKQNYQSKEKTDREALNTELADLDEALRLGGILSHEEYEKKKAEITAKYASERFKKEQEYLQGASAVLNALTSRFEAAKQLELKAAGDNAALKEKIEKKYAKKQQKISIGQALINGAMAQLKILAEVPKADFGVMTAILMTAAAAATAAEIATISNQQFKTGGFTAPADSDSRPAGIVHANEWVASAPLLRNPETRRHIDYLENVQRGIYPRFNTASISAATRGFQIGGHTSTPPPISRTDAMPGVSVAQEQNTAMMGAMIGLLNELKQNGVKSQINTQEVFSKQQQYENNLRASEL